ncbi:hypothetical protein Back11_30520 [Paenibacillus baekrokdamisoli]|uniref:Uncharacterized protein n=1 Tax=Paenibacillus baekrokdamisoli TaxID=1712516 RepID=A0A3G9IS65_9BACL|nr:sugar-binding protein [Paenibacillus baekrokdamisoli]MBB3073056.1 uncharacterized protein YjdB [Paenibacillus baekrokdamisoli]BBH21707.1 hypothetical protein Back11_30520 [Paenibacillus baekrokdamisoli]
MVRMKRMSWSILVRVLILCLTVPYILMGESAASAQAAKPDHLFANTGLELDSGLDSYQIWTAPNTMNILKNQAPLDGNSINLDMAKREYESGQAFVTAGEGGAEVTGVSISDLTYENAIISSQNVQIYVQHYVNVTKGTTGALPIGWYPDALIPLASYMGLNGKVDVKAGENQAFWFTVQTDAGTPSGVYSGSISLIVNGKENRVPINVKVRNFALPEENHAETAFTIWGGDMLLAGHPGITINTPEYWELMRNYYDLMLDYHITAMDLPIPSDNYDKFVKDAAQYVKDPRVSAYRIPYEASDFDDGKAAKLVNDLDKSGLLDKAYYYLGRDIDEPTPALYQKVIDFSNKIKAIDPSLRHIVTSGIKPALAPYVNTFSPLFSEFTTQQDLEMVREHQSNGGHVWWYGCIANQNPYPTYHIDDNLISARLLSWMQKSYGIEGNLYWAVNIYKKYNGIEYVNRDIWNDPVSFQGANGEGSLLYPGDKYGINGAIPTLRLQAIRDGNEDYEYLWLLEQKVKEAAQYLKVDVSVDDIMKLYYDSLFKNVKSFTLNPKDLQDVRSEVADMIEQLDQNPASLIVIGNPLTGTMEKEVTVYAEIGTNVTINGTTILGTTVSGNNVAHKYAARIPSKVGVNEVTITLNKDAQHEVITRHFIQNSRTMEPIMKKIDFNDFEDELSLNGIVMTDGATQEGLSEEHATSGIKSLKVKIPDMTGGSWPAMILPVSSKNKDISKAKTLEFDVFNDSQSALQLFVKVFDKSGHASDHALGGITPGAHHITFPISELTGVDKNNISSIMVWTYPGISEITLYFDHFYFIEPDEEAIKQMEINYSPILPHIDGVLDDAIWNVNKELSYKSGVTNNEAKYNLLYNDQYLYVGVNVKDDHVVNSNAAKPWDDDSVEIYIDGDGMKGEYTDHTVRYVFRYQDNQVYAYGTKHKETDGIKQHTVKTDDGYSLEVAIPWRVIGVTPGSENVIGFNIHVNDKNVNDASGYAQGKLSLTQDTSKDTVSSLSWEDRVFAKKNASFTIAKSLKDEILIDGKLNESTWDINYNLGFSTFGQTNNTAKMGLKWDAKYLYAAYDVKDDVIHAPKERPVWEEDGVELFIDGDFLQGPRTGDHAPHYLFRFGDDTVYLEGFPSELTKGIIQKSVKTDTGYSVEMAIPWETIGITAAENQWIGLTAHINDNDNPDIGVLGLTEDGIMDGANTANYLAFQLVGPPKLEQPKSISLDQPEVMLAVGESVKLNATVLPKNAYDKNVTWTVMNQSSDNVVKVSADGVVTAENLGTAVIRASTISENVYAESHITVNRLQEVTVDEVRLDHTKGILKVGDTMQLNAIVLPEDASNKTVIWSVYGEQPVGVAQITATGLVSAKAPGTAVLRATSKVDATKFAEFNLTVKAIDIPGVPGGSGNGSAGGIRPDVLKVENGTITVNTKVDGDGLTATAEVNIEALEKAWKSTHVDSSGLAVIQIEVKGEQGEKRTEISVPAEAITKLNSKQKIELITQRARMTLSSNFFQEKAATNAKIVTFVIGDADAGKMKWPQHLIDQIGDHPAINFTTKIDGKEYAWSHPNTHVEIEIPYVPSAKEAEKPNHIVIWSINEAGEAVVVSNGKYDPTTKSVRFKVNHFGSFVVMFVNKTFSDLGNHTWAKAAIEALAAREVIQGIGIDTFGPAQNITRADFVTMLVRALDLKGVLNVNGAVQDNKNFNDVFGSDYYYEAIGMAKQLNIISGTGNGSFNPKSEISRQEMFTIAARALTKLEKLQTKGNMEQLSSFIDHGSVAEYAVDSIAGLIQEGLIEGEGNSLHPKANATRAEVAVFMERLLNRIY